MRRALIATALAAAALGGFATAAPAGAATGTFTQSTSIAMPDLGYGFPLPSELVVSQPGIVTKVTMGLRFTSTHSIDVDLLLVSPDGKAIYPISDAGGNNSVAGVDLVFDDDAAAPPSATTALTPGTYKPIDYPTIDEPMGMGAPDPPFAKTLSAFNGVGASGTWKLYSFADFFNGGGGSSMGPWSLNVTTVLPDLTIAAKKQKLKGKVKVTLSSPVAGSVVLGGGVKPKTVQLAADTPTKVKAKIKPKLRKSLAKKIRARGKAKIKVKGTITDSIGDVDTAKAKVKLK